MAARGGLADPEKLGAQLLPGLTYDRIVAVILELEPAGGLEQAPGRVAAVASSTAKVILTSSLWRSNASVSSQPRNVHAPNTAPKSGTDHLARAH